MLHEVVMSVVRGLVGLCVAAVFIAGLCWVLGLHKFRIGEPYQTEEPRGIDPDADPR